MLYLKCKGQVVSIDVDERFADKYINANTVHFEFCERWAGMTITAQFTQNEKTYDVLVDEVTNTVTLPNEITVGEVEISAFGVHPETGVRITTIPVKKKIEKSGFVGDGETPIPPSPDLYAQLIAKVEDAELAQAENIKNAVDAYLTENPVEPGATKAQAAQIEANRKAIEEYVPPVTSVNGMTGDVVIAAGGGAASSVEWSNVVNKPETYPPEAHGHKWNDVAEKPETYPPSEHKHSYADLEDKPTIPTVPRFLPNPYSLTINGISYDGSNAVEVTIDAGNDVEIDETLTQGGKAADAKKTGDALDQLSQQMVNYRATVGYLDNPDFRIAQAGYGGRHNIDDPNKISNIYAADRWILLSGEVTPPTDGNGIKITGAQGEAAIRQYVDNPKRFIGKTMTFAAKVRGVSKIFIGIYCWDVNKNGPVSSGEVVVGNDWTVVCKTVTVSSDCENIVVTLNHMLNSDATYEVAWADLYEGSFTAETLPPHVPLDPVLDLQRCQRRFYPIPRDGASMAYVGYATNSNTVRLTVPTPVPMAQIPSVYFPEGSVSMKVYASTMEADPTAAQVAFIDSCAVSIYLTCGEKIPGWIPIVARFNSPAMLVADIVV